MPALNPQYLCTCDAPKSLMYLGQETGLCFYCRMVYDPQLYEMRLREHVPDLPEGDLHEILMEVDPNYRSLHART